MAPKIPPDLKPYVIGIGRINVENQDRNYLLISRDYAPDLDLFAGYNHGLPFVSDAVPIDLRPVWIAHEIIEFEKFRDKDGKWLPNHCTKALVEELRYLGNADLGEYYLLRAKFFRSWVDYLERTQESSEFIEEIKKSRDGLEGLVKKFGIK